MRSRSRTLLTVAVWSLATAASAASLEDVKQGGKLRVAVYTEFAPFSDDGEGIDVDVARALAAKLGVQAEILSFRDADSMDDDLRNMNWKGHYIRKQKLADVMMHVPVDPVLASKNEQVIIGAPYYRERLVVARNRNQLPQLITLEPFRTEKIGVQFDTIEDHFLMNAFGGSIRANVVHFATMPQAVAALRANELAAVMGRQSHIEAALGDAASRFAIAPISTPGLTTTGWKVGVAVKAEFPDLAAALEKAMAELRDDGTLERIFTKRGVTYAAPNSIDPH